MNLKHAGTIIEAVLQELEKRNKAAVIAVCDASGELVALKRMDDAPLPSIQISMNKAYTAAREKKESKEIGNKFKSGGDIAFYGDPRITGFGGGIPIFDHSNKIIGAVGVSGLSEEEDVELGKIGINSIKK